MPNSEYERIGKIHKQRFEEIGVDGIIIYDLQDEKSRNSSERIFDFVQTLDPQKYYEDFLHTSIEPIIYKAVSKYDTATFYDFLQKEKDYIYVFVGSSSSKVVPKLTLDEAYRLTKNSNFNSVLGGICIPERHVIKKDEHIRMIEKSKNGCKFFISQAIYNVENAKKFIDDYAQTNFANIPIIFTFIPCGSKKTLDFIKWLGIFVEDRFEKKLIDSNDMIQTSINLSLEFFNFIYKYSLSKGISVGANVESISKQRDEIQASLTLLDEIKKIIKRASYSYRS
ncbi:methylenetetrahydrofolate reductase family protein [Campylobacter blaseri]|nr:methylenetetrahydrofolate reductase family protein [Campylobacter blaseri]